MGRTARRDAGAGSLHLDTKTGLWVAVVELPSHDGRRRRKVRRRSTKEEASAALREMTAELGRTGDLPTASPRLETWMRQWLARREAERLKPRTAAGYRGSIERYIVPAIGSIRLDRLTPSHVHRLHDSITSAGLSSTTALQAHRILAVALRDAEREGKVSRNVAALVDAPRRRYAPRPALTAEQARTLLLSAAGDPHTAAAWSVALLAGLRQGERLGLRHDQVDLDRGLITVAWQLQRLSWRHGCDGGCERRRGAECPDRHLHIPSSQESVAVDGALVLVRPKSLAGWRQVPLADPLTEVLARYMADRGPGPEGLVFHRDGHPVDPKADSVAWAASLEAAGLPHVPLHSARHTCSTLLFELGVDEQTRMSILGHSSAAVTRGYTHVTTPVARGAMEALGRLVAGED